MADDLQRLNDAEEKLLAAIKLASEVTGKLSSGDTTDLEKLCSEFLDNIQDSQTCLLQLSAKYAEPLPFENSDTAAKLEAQAAEYRVVAAQEKLRQQQECGDQPDQQLVQG